MIIILSITLLSILLPYLLLGCSKKDPPPPPPPSPHPPSSYMARPSSSMARSQEQMRRDKMPSTHITRSKQERCHLMRPGDRDDRDFIRSEAKCHAEQKALNGGVTPPKYRKRKEERLARILKVQARMRKAKKNPTTKSTASSAKEDVKDVKDDDTRQPSTMGYEV